MSEPRTIIIRRQHHNGSGLTKLRMLDPHPTANYGGKQALSESWKGPGTQPGVHDPTVQFKKAATSDQRNARDAENVAESANLAPSLWLVFNNTRFGRTRKISGN